MGICLVADEQWFLLRKELALLGGCGRFNRDSPANENLHPEEKGPPYAQALWITEFPFKGPGYEKNLLRWNTLPETNSSPLKIGRAPRGK